MTASRHLPGTRTRQTGGDHTTRGLICPPRGSSRHAEARADTECGRRRHSHNHSRAGAAERRCRTTRKHTDKGQLRPTGLQRGSLPLFKWVAKCFQKYNQANVYEIISLLRVLGGRFDPAELSSQVLSFLLGVRGVGPTANAKGRGGYLDRRCRRGPRQSTTGRRQTKGDGGRGCKMRRWG